MAEKFVSTGEMARILHCSQQTAIRSIDSGEIPGFRLPGSRFRRARLVDVQKYAIEHDIPLDPEYQPRDLASPAAADAPAA